MIAHSMFVIDNLETLFHNTTWTKINNEIEIEIERKKNMLSNNDWYAQQYLNLNETKYSNPCTTSPRRFG